ncbi:amine sulfotransferase-like [Anomaloglossus baeobatrachus]|uniref:amine sulfotransferase-like n=1 Tax=Anomaloglossus baeobatrachus TaxID=238106 RepID=UPI003F4F84DC
MDRDAIEEALKKLMFEYKGIYFETRITSPQIVEAIEFMEVRESDVFLVTYPKSGTVWTQQILSLIMNEGHRNGTEHIDNMTRAPWLEYNIFNVNFSNRPSPRLFTSHLPYYLMPRDLLLKKGKIVYVSRNPKDCMVSYHHFYKRFSTFNFKMNIEQFMDLFTTGRVLGGSWFDHVRDWYTHKDEFNILFVTYEEMVKDLRSAVLKICKFIDKSLDEKAVDMVVEKAMFKTMKNDPDANYTFYPTDLIEASECGFLRRGVVGDWKTIMTMAQSGMFDKVYKEKIGDLPIKVSWDLEEESTS